MPDLLAAERVHLVGIGGSGMSALASLLLQMGKQVSGSDIQIGGSAQQLQTLGATVYAGHAAEHIGGADLVVRSAAVPADNVEVAEAHKRGVPTHKLAEAVAGLIRGRVCVAVAGTHGKTTTTTLVSAFLQAGGLDPLALIGADSPGFPLGARAGDGPMVIEADEYDRRFLEYWPEVAVVTSIEADHLDYFRDLDEIRAVFQELVERLPHRGRLVACADEPWAASMRTDAERATYGFADDADWQLSAYTAHAAGSRFTLSSDGRSWEVESPLLGMYNACNAAAAIAVADYFGVGLRTCLAALEAFEGPRRRFETKGERRGIRIVDDYAHHPSEVAAVLEAARAAAAGEVWIVFQPHTTNRTFSLLDDFSKAFGAAQHVLVLPIYKPSGREAAAREVTSADLVQRLGGDARAVAGFDEAMAAIAGGARAGDLVLTVGAGDVTRLSDLLVERL